MSYYFNAKTQRREERQKYGNILLLALRSLRLCVKIIRHK